MKQKMYIGAITLVIAGLLLTSTTGMGKPITPVTTATKIMDAEEITPAVRQEAFNGIVSMLPTEGIGALKNFNKITATHDHSVIASHVEQRNLANPNSISLPAQKVTNEKVVPVTYPDRRTRDGLLFWNTHPAVASNGAGMVMRVYEEVWQNESVPTENYMTLVYSGSNDGGVTWGPGFSFIDWIIGLPVPASMPTIDYWGKNGTLDVWTVSFRDGDDSGAFHLLTWKTNATTIIDLPNAIWDDIYWPSMGYSDLKNPEITCNNNYGPGFFGAIAMTLDHAGGNDQVYYFFANFSNPGQFHIFGWVVDSVTYTQGFDIAYDLDNPARLTFMCDEFANDQTQPPSLDAFTWGHFLDDTTSPGCGLPGWWDPSGVWSFEYPDLDMYNHTIVYALETYNQIEDPAKAHCYLEAGNYYDDGTTRGTGWFANDVVWYDPAGTYRFPEVEHVADQTFIMTCIHTNTTTQESELMFAVSIDDGVTWVGNSLYTWSGDDAVVPGYRGHTLSKGPIGAEIAIWEYVSTEDPDDDVIFLHNNFNTAVLNGHVTYLESEPVVTPDIQIYNIDPVDGFKKTITGDANGYYNIVLVRGFDIWTNATIRVIARNPTHYVGVTEHFFDTISHVNTMDVVVDVYYLDLKNFPMYPTTPYGTYTNSQLCGPAVLQMMLNYIWWNSSNFTTPPMKFDNQTTIYNEALSHNYNPSANYLDTNGMWWYLEHNRPMPYSAYGYHFVKDARATVGEALGDIAFWIDYEIGTYGGLKPGHPSHVPVAVPAYGDYSNWMVVRGIHADQAVYPTYPVTATIYGLWVNDPSSNGLGENTYKTADEFTTTYFLPMNVAGDNPAYNDKYVSITEPPEQGTINVNIANSPQLLTPEQMRTKTGIVKVDPVKETALDAIQTLASETDDQSIPTQLIAEKVITVNGNGRRYYIVTFTMETPRISTTHITTIVLPVVAAVAIDYSTGALMEISIPKTPVKFFDGLSYTSGKYIQIGPSTFDIAYRVNIGGFFYDISPDGTMTPAV